MEDKDRQMVNEPVAATLSESFKSSGLFGQVMKLSRPDKVALIKYLKQDIEPEGPFSSDEFGRIALTQEMRDAVGRAESDLENGKCFSEADFEQRFAKWL